jgi:cytochrome oxidase Cu insertion factor (SCO1/SenC/PrrC family)
MSDTSASNTEIDQAQQKRGRRLFLFMFAIFFGPFLMAALAKYYGWFALSDTVNYGSLITPPVNISDTKVTVVNSDKLIQMREKWSLLIMIPGDCDEHCLKSVREIESIHLLLNRDIQRVQLLAVNYADVEAGLYRNDLSKTSFQQGIGQEFNTAKLDMYGTYLIDPKGFVILHYPQVLDGKRLQKDLKRVLKYSRIG